MKRGKYKHFKGKEYELLYIAKNSETLKDMVVYKALYADEKIWVRPLEMWNEIVNHEGECKERFRFLGEENED